MTDPLDLHELMTDAVSRVSPEPPPLGRLNSVNRRRRRSRLAATSVAAAVALSGIGWAVVDQLPGAGHQSVRVGPAGTVPVPATSVPSSKAVVPPPGVAVVVPNLVGLSLSQVQTVVGGLQVVVGAEMLDPSTPAGTVVAQTPVAGAAAPSVSITIAVPQTVPCTGAQLALTYLGGGAGAGEDFGTIVVRDVSALWCTLAGPIQVVGLDSTGRAVTQTVTFPVPRPLVLSPLTPAPPHGQRPRLSDFEAAVVLSAGYRDGPQPNGLCDTMQVIPADWRLTLPGPVVLTVRNDDPEDMVAAFQRLITCRGQMASPTPVQLSGS